MPYHCKGLAFISVFRAKVLYNRWLLCTFAHFGVLRQHCHDPPMVGSTWPRVRSTLESNCSPALSQGAASLRLVVDLLIVIFTIAAHIRCLVIGVVLVRLIALLMFSLSCMRPWGLFSNQLLGPLTWYLVSHDGLLIMLPLPPISADALWDSICFHYL